MGGSDTFRDRGQLILVGALALAIVLVGLALVLNSAIYAENFATRANQGEAGQITALEQQAVQGAGGMIRHHNRNVGSHTSYDDLSRGLQSGVDGWSGSVVRDTARKGQYVSADFIAGSADNGTRVLQDDGTEFQPQNSTVQNSDGSFAGVTYWTVAPDINEMRAFTIEAERDTLGNITETEAENYLRNLGTESYDLDKTPPFAVVYDVDGESGSVNHAFTIYKADGGSGPDAVKLSYYDEAVDRVYTCEIADAEPTFEVEVSDSEVEGGDDRCNDVLAFQSEISDNYQLYYVSGSKIKGDWEFVIDETLSSFRSDFDSFWNHLALSPEFSDYYEPHPSESAHDDTYGPSSPYVEPAIYSAEVRFRYQSDRARYNTTRTVAPDRP